MAAAAHCALDNNVQRLAEDHERARRPARGLAGIDGIGIDPDLVETNVLTLKVRHAERFCARMAERGALVASPTPDRVRALIHLDVDDAGIELALAAAAESASERPGPWGGEGQLPRACGTGPARPTVRT